MQIFLINQCKKKWKKHSPPPPKSQKLKFFHLCKKDIWVVKWCIWAPWALIWVFENIFSDSRKISKKNFWNTDLSSDRYSIFFKRQKLCQNEAEPNSKKYGESLWFFLYIPVGERGTLTLWSFEKKRVKNFRSEKINLSPKITNLNEILSFWSKFWDFDRTFVKKNVLGIPIWVRSVFRSVFHFFKRAKLPQNRVKPASKKYGWIHWFFLYKYSIGLR